MSINFLCFEKFVLKFIISMAMVTFLERIYDMLKNSLHQQSPGEETDEGIRELVDIALKKMVRIKKL